MSDKTFLARNGARVILRNERVAKADMLIREEELNRLAYLALNSFKARKDRGETL